MRRIFTVLAVPLLFLAAFVAAEHTLRVGDALAGPSPPVEEHAALQALHRTPQAVSAHPPTAATGDPVPFRLEKKALADRAAERARALLVSLESWAASGAPAFPLLEIEELRDLLTRHPEVAEIFLAALGGDDARLRAYLLFAFHKVQDERLRSELLAAHGATDRAADRLTEILADRVLVLAMLRQNEQTQLRSDLVNRMGPALLGDPEVFDELVRIAREDADDRTRSRAISRLGKVDCPESRELLLEILEDPVRALRDRQAAARQLRDASCDRAVEAFLEILEGDDATSLKRFAAHGLKHAGERPEARSALLGLMRDTRGDLQARKNAASSLAYCLGSLEGRARNALEEEVRGALDEIARSEGAGDLTVHSMIALSRTLGPGYRAELREFYEHRASRELKQQMRAHPQLKRALER